MNREKPIDKTALKEFLSQAEAQMHHIYLLLAGLPKEHFCLYRMIDRTGKREGYDDPAENTYTISEFYRRYDDFLPEDEFGIYFYVYLDRIDSDRVDEYSDTLCVDMREGATVELLRSYIGRYMQDYCEAYMRENKPFRLTPQVIGHFGFTTEDVDKLRPLVGLCNDRARRKLQAEYDALKELDCVRK